MAPSSDNAPSLETGSGLRRFVIIWMGQFGSLVGSSMTRFAIGIWMFERTGLATTFTTMIFFSHVPRLLLSPFAGAIVDRFNRRLILIVSDFGTAMTTVGIFFLIRSSSLEIWHVYGLVALSSAFESVQFPAYSSAITMLVDKRHYARTSAMQSLADDGSRLLAPILAALLIVNYRIESVILVDVVSFAAAIGTLAVVPIPQPRVSKTGKDARGSLLKEAAFGFRFIFGNRSLLGLQLNFLMINLVSGMSTGLRVPMILARSANSELILGQSTSIAFAGGIAGSIIMSIWGGPKRRINAVLLGIIAQSLSIAVLGLGRGLIGWSIGGFLVFLFIPLSNAPNQAIWQSKTPADVQGKVFAARRVTGQITFPIAILMTGPLADSLFEPAMSGDGKLAAVFGGLVGSGPGAGMSLVMVLIAGVGLALPVVSYLIPAIRNVENLVPDADIDSADLPTPASASHEVGDHAGD